MPACFSVPWPPHGCWVSARNPAAVASERSSSEVSLEVCLACSPSTGA